MTGGAQFCIHEFATAQDCKTHEFRSAKNSFYFSTGVHHCAVHSQYMMHTTCILSRHLNVQQSLFHGVMTPHLPPMSIGPGLLTLVG